LLTENPIPEVPISTKSVTISETSRWWAGKDQKVTM
jgi:hypothetical protein